MLMCRSWALLNGKLVPSVEDVIAVANAVISHRMSLRFAAQAQGLSISQIISETIDRLDSTGVAA